ncbi:hypothetical protein ACLKA7_009168 [Drosophila subpalustris]
MQLVIGLPFLMLLLLTGSGASPTFDRIAEVLLNVLDDGPHYARPEPYRPLHPPHPVHPAHPVYPAHPAHPSGPLIQEGYDHGYDYYYGGGSSHGFGNAGYQSPPHDYYQAPAQGFHKGYYPEPQYPNHNHYDHSAPNYGQQYGRSAGTAHNSVGGYQKHGY